MTAPLATDPRDVAEQAAAVAAAWSPSGAPPSGRLTAAQFEVLRDDRELLAIAATIPPERLPPLLSEATFLVLELEPKPLRDWFPTVGEPQAMLGPRFAMDYRAFCLDHRESLLELDQLLPAQRRARARRWRLDPRHRSGGGPRALRDPRRFGVAGVQQAERRAARAAR